MNEHSLHSPFIYGFYKDVIKSDRQEPVHRGIENVRQMMSKTFTEVEVQDFGAGSAYESSAKRKVSDIAKKGIATAKFSRLYSRIIQSIEARNVLELGTSIGINSMYLASAPCVKNMITIEGCKNLTSLAESNFSGFSNSNIQLINATINQGLVQVFNRVNSLDFVLFDANHTYEATLEYYHKCKALAHERSIFVFDDIHWSEGMTAAWREIQKEIEVTLTIDLQQVGIVFFRKELEKEDYVLSW